MTVEHLEQSPRIGRAGALRAGARQMNEHSTLLAGRVRTSAGVVTMT